MTQNKRIILNTVATYGRSMFGVACGIFTTRWVLEALGQVDFGLYTIIGGMIIFLNFLNIQLAGAITRYYAFSIGQAKVAKDSEFGMRECRAWFTTAVMIHTIVPVVIVSIGCPLGLYAIRHGWISVPPERLNACLWVWRIVCTSALLCMMSVPFQAMYTAKQYIAELTIYSFFQTIVRTAFVYYMVVNPRDWLVAYAVGMGLIIVSPQLIICTRAFFTFQECRIIPTVFREFGRIKQVANYALWTTFGGIGYVASHQCMGILINNFFGARTAGGFGVSQTVAGEAASLTGSLQGAFQPAIATSYGAGEMEYMRTMAFRVCKVGTVLTLIFVIPMALEIDELLLLWLKNPPPYAASMCLCTLAFIAIEKMSCGHIIALNASGKIAKVQILRGVLLSMVIPLALIASYLGRGPIAAMSALPIAVVFVDLGDVWLARKRVGMSITYWVRHIVAPISVLILVGSFVGYLPQVFLPASFVRMLITTACVLCTLIPFSWFMLMSVEERDFICGRVGKSCNYLKRYFSR